MIKVLGAFGSRYQNYFSTSFKISDSIYLDAGNILSDKNLNPKHIIISHSHFDHIVDLPFIIDNLYEKLTSPIHVYASKSTIKDLKDYIFNDKIWPDFSIIPLLNKKKSIKLFNIEETFYIDNIEFIPFKANHTVETFGFIINKEYLISSDTYLNDELIYLANKYKIPNLIIEVSFPNRLKKLAKVSKHLTPELLEEMLKKLTYKPKNIFVYHVKPMYLEEIKKELNYKILFDGDEI